MAKRTALVVCPGRGTYNKDELGYLARHHVDKAAFIDAVDGVRAGLGQTTVSDLDKRARYSVAEHTRGEVTRHLRRSLQFLHLSVHSPIL